MSPKAKRKKNPPVLLSFKPGGTVEGRPGETILRAAWRGDIPLDAPCGGQGICGRCRVRVDPAAAPIDDERRLLTTEERRAGWRLACRATVTAAANIHLLRRRRPATVPVRTVLPPRRGRPIGGGKGCGVAVDMGTTTIAVQLWDLPARQLIATASAPNPQIPFGADVISRISFASQKGSLGKMRDLLRGGVSDLIEKTAKRSGIRRREISAVVLSGNTVMQHFFMGVDPSPLARTPFEPPFLEQPAREARAVGLGGLEGAVVRLVPCISAFLGGDAVAGVTSIRYEGGEVPALLIDMGTNAEVVLLRKRSLIATSAAAGPALEGGNISNGLPAGRGAVEGVDFSGDLSLEVIGGEPPLGICGSGLLDVTALLLRFGLLLPDGRLLSASEAAGGPWKKLSRRLEVRGGMNIFTVAPAADGRRAVSVTQEDFRELQLARSAIVTAWELLLRKAGMRPEQIERVYLAGGFGYSLRKESLARTGILHDSWMSRLTALGNSSLAGASLTLLDESLLARSFDLASSVRALHLAESPSFQKNFLRNLSFPEG